MRPRTLLVLFLVVVGLAAFIGFYERKLPSSEERAAAAKKVLQFDKSKVSALAVVRGGRELRLERIEPAPGKETGGKQGEEKDEAAGEGSEGAAGSEDIGEWRISRPLAARADASMVASLLDALLGLEKNRTIDKPDPKTLGLDRPQATVRVTTPEGIEVLDVGAKVPTSAAVIVAVAGRPEAYVASDALLANLDRAPGEWRDRQVFHGKRDEIERIALSGGHSRLVLLKKKESFWLESPLADRADKDLVETLLSNISGLTVQSFVDGPASKPAELGLAPPQGQLEVFAKGAAAPLRVLLGAPVAPTENVAMPAATGEEGQPPSPARYLQAGPQVFEAQTGLADDVARAPQDWRSRALTGLEVYQVESLRVKDGASEIALTHAGTDWKRGKETISYTPVSDLLFAATGARADRLLSPEEARAMGAALDRPALTLAMKGAAGEEIVTLYPPVAEGVPARVSGRDVLLLLPRATLEDLQKQVAAVRTAKPEKPAKGTEPEP